jgi:hypothetical protein
MTCESWTNGIARPADGLAPGIIYIFVVFLGITTFGLLNIVVGSFVEHSMATANEDAEYRLAQKKAEFQNCLTELRDLFLATDADGSGFLSLEEFESMTNDDRMIRVFSELEVMSTPVEFFASIDLDEEGSVSLDEFVKGIMRSRAKPNNLDVFVVDGLVRRCEKMILEQKAAEAEFSEVLEEKVTKKIAEMQGALAVLEGPWTVL